MASAESDRESEGARLAALRELELAAGPFPDLDRLVAFAADICGAEQAAFTIHDETRAFHISANFDSSEILPRSACMSSVVLGARESVCLADASADARFAHTRYVTAAPFVRSFIGVPVGLEPDQPLGVLAVGHTAPGRFGERETERLRKTAELISAFLSQRRAALHAERAAAQTEAERARQRLFEQIFDAIQEGVNVHAPRRGVIEINPACLDIMGMTREEVGERDDKDVRWHAIRPDGSKYRPNEYPALITLRTGRPVRNERLGVQGPDGEIRWLSVNTVALRQEQTGEIEYAVVTMKDITEQHLAEVRLTEQYNQLGVALEEAEQANRAKTDFMGVMSHELRTPMNAVLGCATLLSQTGLGPLQKRTLGVLQDAGKQMLAVLNDLLDLSGLNADKVRIEREPGSLLRLIEDAAVIWAADVRAKQLSLTVMVEPELARPRMIDTARLLQVIGNLVANAIKFTSEGGITLRAWSERGKGGQERVLIEVEDTGPGVPPEAAERIFQPFEQIDISAKRRHGGLGLGLHIARRLAIAMDGDITLDTEPGEGTRFSVSIAAPFAPEMEAPAATSAAAAFAPKDILCVDDNPRNLFVMASMLRAAGHQATECGSGREALELLDHYKYDVVLLDMVMPEIDGMDVLARLREAEGPNASTPVIACTANALPHQIASYRNAGSADVLPKPIDPRAMLAAVAGAA